VVLFSVTAPKSTYLLPTAVNLPFLFRW